MFGRKSRVEIRTQEIPCPAEVGDIGGEEEISGLVLEAQGQGFRHFQHVLLLGRRTGLFRQSFCLRGLVGNAKSGGIPVSCALNASSDTGAAEGLTKITL